MSSWRSLVISSGSTSKLDADEEADAEPVASFEILDVVETECPDVTEDLEAKYEIQEDSLEIAAVTTEITEVITEEISVVTATEELEYGLEAVEDSEEVELEVEEITELIEVEEIEECYEVCEEQEGLPGKEDSVAFFEVEETVEVIEETVEVVEESVEVVEETVEVVEETEEIIVLSETVEGSEVDSNAISEIEEATEVFQFFSIVPIFW